VPVTVDDFARLDEEVGVYVADVYGRAVEAWLQPQIERDDLAEYNSLDDDAHGRILAQQGKENYQVWVDEMERLRVKHGGTANGMG
jgi:hypothetical protein